MTKTDRNKKLMHMLDLGMSMAAIARYMGISRQRVLQIVQDNGGLPKGYEHGKPVMQGRTADAIRLLKQMPLADAARKLGVNYTTLRGAAIRQGIQPIPYKHLEPGCPKCKTNPYARGYCKNCYARWQRKEIRNGKKD